MWPNEVKCTSVRDFNAAILGVAMANGGEQEERKPMSREQLKALGIEGF